MSFLAGVLAGVACGDDDVPDAAEIQVSAESGLRTTEAGGDATFTVSLTSIPLEAVTVAVSSSDDGEGLVAPRSIIFNTDNWESGVTVTVIGVDDEIVDGDQSFDVTLAAGAAGSETVTITNADDDGPGVTVTPSVGLMTSENGASAAFTVQLNTMPTAEVAIAVASADEGEGTVSPATLTFTTENWNAPQIVTVTGVDDDLADGEASYTVTLAPATSDDPTYDGIDATDVAVVNVDNDSPGVLVTPVVGLETSEDGDADEFMVVLNTQPSANVTIAVSSNAPDEGTPSPTSLIFTPENWDAPQVVTVTGEDDDAADGEQAYTIVLGAAASADGGYQGVAVDDVAVTNADNDSPSIVVEPTTGLVTTESGGFDTFDIVLATQPTADVTIAISTASDEVTTDVASVTFTSLNWQSAQTVTVTGEDDPLDDGNQGFTIVLAAAVSDDDDYDGLNPADVSGNNTDDEAPGFIVNPTSGLQTTEGGGTASFTVVLISQPTATVSVDVASNDATEGVASVSSLTFTTSDWNTPQTVTVTGQNDLNADGNQAYAVVLSPAVSADPAYSGFNPPDVSLTNIDNDSPGVTLLPTSNLTVSEFGDPATFTLVLNSQPTADVTIGLTSQRPDEATIDKASVTFTTANWNVEQVVTVTGVEDLIGDGNQSFFIVTAAAVSADPGYNNLNPADVRVNNFDNDSATLIIDAPSLLLVDETGATDTFTMVLTVEPTADVTCAVGSSDTTEGTITSPIVFTPANYATPQTVTLTGVDDALVDGNQLFTINTQRCTSTDPAYNGLNPRDLNARNEDDDD